MKISKTHFIHFMKYLRFRSLDHYLKNHEKIEVDFTNLLAVEDRSKLQQMMDAGTEDDDIDDHDDSENTYENSQIYQKKRDLKMEMMLPYYNKIEALTAIKIKNVFGGNIIYSMSTMHQKHFEAKRNGFEFHCYLDGFQEDKDHYRVIETKATTSNKFIKLTFTTEDKEKLPVFVEGDQGILRLRHELGLDTNEHYQKRIQSLLDKYSPIGKYIYDISYQRYVIESSKTKLSKKTKYYLAVLNSQYIFDGRYDDRGEPIYLDDIMTLIDVTYLTELYQPIIIEDSLVVCDIIYQLQSFENALDHVLQKFEELTDFSAKEIYQDYVPIKNSIFTILAKTSISRKEPKEALKPYQLISENILEIKDIPDSYIEQNKKNMIQKQVVTTKETYIDPRRIEAGLSVLKYPLYHLDFESFNCPLPRFKGESPYMQSLFQFSIHIEHQPGICDFDLDNYYFLAPNHSDHRYEIAKRLTEIIKNDGGSVIAYNYAFEKTRIKELAHFFPDLSQKLMNIHDRVFDLMHLLGGNKKLYERLGFGSESVPNYYHEDLQGSYSIKKVLPVFTDLTYKDLVVGNGNEAMVAYVSFPKLDKEAFEQLYNHLVFYCKQDTWAMVLILNQLRKLIQL